MTHSIHPKIYRLQHEIITIERHLHNAEQRMGVSNPAILQNYREMIRARQELMELLSVSPDGDHTSTTH
ncbi:hypothetical protein NBRC116188_14200 [Oceaniserpentilla sp. 4NH20-0058]|uniref:hypothetical protein n=1 Tax=Oceaniserpentilla sp. 4NH20-0058 TaxID=3127660 RepID=UPI0031087400